MSCILYNNYYYNHYNYQCRCKQNTVSHRITPYHHAYNNNYPLSGVTSLPLACNPLRSGDSQPFVVAGDLTHEEDVRRIVESVVNHFGRLDILVRSSLHFASFTFILLGPIQGQQEGVSRGQGSCYRTNGGVFPRDINKSKCSQEDISCNLNYRSHTRIPSFSY